MITRTEDERKTAMASAIAVAVMDEHIHENELEVLTVYSMELGFTTEEFLSILKDPFSVERTVPNCKSDRASDLATFIWVAISDGNISDDEGKALIAIAQSYGFKLDEFDDIFKRLNAGQTPDAIAEHYNE